MKWLSLVWLGLCPLLFAHQSPLPLTTDSRIQRVMYAPDDVIDLHGMTFFNSQIILAHDETIVDIQCGDAAAWTVSVNSAIPYIANVKPTVSSSKTDLMITSINVHGETRHYVFHLMCDPSLATDSVTFAIQLVYPKSLNVDKHSQPISATQPEPTPMAHSHWDYTFHGCRQAVPTHVFDDGHVTYLQFHANQVLPAIFSISDRSAKEALVNTRQESMYLVVLGVYPQLTLRDGDRCVASLFNRRLIKARKNEGA